MMVWQPLTSHFGQSYSPLVTATMATLIGQPTTVKVSMNVEYSIDDSDYLQNRLLKLQIQADMPDSIAGYQPKFIYNPCLLTVVSFENGNILGERSFSWIYR